MARGEYWTAEQDNALKTMWAAGMSGSEIGALMGKTRCAILGKVYRLEFGERATGHKASKRRTPEQIEATKRAKAERRNERRRTQYVSVVMVKRINLEALRCVEVEPMHKSLIELDPDGCRYPFGDGPFTFCNHTQFEGSSYCGPHLALSRRGHHESR